MPPTDIPSLKPTQRVHDAFLVLDVETRTLETGEAFTILRLGNSTGEIATEPFWPTRQDEVAGVKKGHPVQVIGEVGVYRQKKQVKVSSLRVLPKDAVNLAAFLPTVGPVGRYWDTIDGWRQSIVKPRLTGVLDLFFDDDEFRHRFELCPASIRGHHAQLGGLLKHTTEVATIARAISRTSGADHDIVLAGVLLHDIGKIEAYSWDGAFDYTVAGSLLGHVVLGSLMLDQRLRLAAEPPCTEEQKWVLLHMILSHHGRLEYGSPVQPMTLEAEVLHWADNASAKSSSVADAIRNADNFLEGAVSKPQWVLDRRRVYRHGSDWGSQANDGPPNA